MLATMRRTCSALSKIDMVRARLNTYKMQFSVYRQGPVAVKIRSFSSATSSDTDTTASSLEGYSLSDPECNVTHSIASRIGTNLHRKPNHPLYTIKHIIQDYWQNTKGGGGGFVCQDNLSPIVSVEDNFDSLLIPQDHVSRSKSDTYYLNKSTVLRCHTSAHQVTLLKQGLNRFLITGDVYRYVCAFFCVPTVQISTFTHLYSVSLTSRDEVDSSHYPIFHQMEGVKMFSSKDFGASVDRKEQLFSVEEDLKRGLEGMAKALFGQVQMRWVDAYFPFTDPSFELEIYFGGEWLEVLGCGVIQQEIIENSGRGSQPGWAFGLGLERLAMVLFGIPDIRLFWTADPRFHKQFESGKIVTFIPYSKFPPCYKDISFWTPPAFHPNDLHELVRNVAGDLAEKVELIDSFVHPKTERLSNCFRISYRSMDRSLTNEEVDDLQEQVRSLAVDQLQVELR